MKFRNPKRKKWLIAVSILLAAAALCVWAFYSGLVVRSYTVKTNKLEADTCVTVAVIADLHSHVYGNAQQPLIEKIRAAQPDIIALVGDIVDDAAPEEGAWLFLDGIRGIAPVYYVSGNHEFWSGEAARIKQTIAGYGVTVLENETQRVAVNGAYINISGVDDPEVLREMGDTALSDAGYQDLISDAVQTSDDAVNILLAHRPERINTYRQFDFDLVLSGHAHGGQIRIPLLLNGLFAPDQGFFPEYAGGRYDFGGQTMIVSRGLSFNSHVPRVFNPPEVVVVKICG